MTTRIDNMERGQTITQLPADWKPESVDKSVADRITEYLSLGGLFNPELMNPEAVRWMLVDARNALTASERRVKELDALLREALPDGIEDQCDECGGEPGRCLEVQPNCYIRRSRIALGDSTP